MLPTQVNYWALKENERHNRQTENIQRQEADTRRIEAETNRERLNLAAVDTLTAQQEAETRRQAQQTNEARRLQDYELGLLQAGIGSQNAESTRIQALANAEQARAYARRADVETQFIPYSTGANIAGSIVATGSKLIPGIKNLAKSAKSGIQSIVYNLRN